MQTPIDLGLLAECMLFYGRVKLVADRGMLEQLIRTVDPSVLIDLMQDGLLEVHYIDGGYGIRTENTGTPTELHRPISYSLPSWELQEVAPVLFTEVTGKAGRGRRLAKGFQDRAHEFRIGGESIATATVADFHDHDYLVGAIQTVLKVLAPEYPQPEPFQFSLEEVGKYFRVHTNIDFEAANISHHRHYPVEISTVNPAFLLSQLVHARGEFDFASRLDAELATDETTSAIMGLKLDELALMRAQNRDRISNFQANLLLQAHAIREVINSGERSFTDFVDVLHLAEEFKAWLASRDASTDLLEQYYEEVSRRTWISTIPAKALRWTIVTGVGVFVPQPVGTIAAGSLAAADSFLLERLVEGWKPNRFVPTLKRFVK